MAGVLGWLDDKLNGDADMKLKDDYLMIPEKKDGREPEPLEDDKKDKKKDNRYVARDYKVTVPKRQELPATKILNDATAIFHYLNSSEDYFFQSENFQRKYLYEVPKLLWNTERVEDLGDFVLLFPNPDKKAAQSLDPAVENGILLKDAEEAFHLIFDTTYNYPYKKKFTTALLEAFKKAFLELDEYVMPETAVIDDEEIEFGKSTKQDSKRKRNNHEAHEAEKPKQPNPHQQSVNPSESAAPLDSKRASGAAVAPRDGPQKQVSEKPQEPPKIEQEDGQLGLTKMRRVWGGGLYKAYQEKDKDGELRVKSWSREPSTKTRDLMTLVRKSVMAVLANQGFLLREVFLEDAETIAVVLTLPECNLHKVAVEMRLARPVEFGVADLASLEPVDARHRPLRVHAVLHDESHWNRAYLAEAMSPEQSAEARATRNLIVDLLRHDCSLKRIVRLCRGRWGEEDKDFVDDVFDHCPVPLSAWKAYASYLTELALRLFEIEKLHKKLATATNIFYEDLRIAGTARVSRKSSDLLEVCKFTNQEVVTAFEKSLEANPELQNVWHTLGSGFHSLKKPEYFFEYTTPTNKMRPRNRLFYSLIWKDHMKIFERKRLEEITTSAGGGLDAPEAEKAEKAENAEKAEEEEEAEEAEEAEEPGVKRVAYNYSFTKLERLKVSSYLVLRADADRQSPGREGAAQVQPAHAEEADLRRPETHQRDRREQAAQRRRREEEEQHTLRAAQQTSPHRPQVPRTLRPRPPH